MNKNSDIPEIIPAPTVQAPLPGPHQSLFHTLANSAVGGAKLTGKACSFLGNPGALARIDVPKPTLTASLRDLTEEIALLEPITDTPCPGIVPVLKQELRELYRQERYINSQVEKRTRLFFQFQPKDIEFDIVLLIKGCNRLHDIVAHYRTLLYCYEQRPDFFKSHQDELTKITGSHFSCENDLQAVTWNARRCMFLDMTVTGIGFSGNLAHSQWKESTVTHCTLDIGDQGTTPNLRDTEWQNWIHQFADLALPETTALDWNGWRDATALIQEGTALMRHKTTSPVPLNAHGMMFSDG